MGNNEDGASYWFLLLITVGGIFAMLNMYRWFKNPEISTSEEYEKIISEKDSLIAAYELKIRQYQQIIENDTKIKRNNME